MTNLYFRLTFTSLIVAMIFMLLTCSPVTAGTTSSGIDATLILGGSITGRVTDSSGTGIADVMVYASDASGGSGMDMVLANPTEVTR